MSRASRDAVDGAMKSWSRGNGRHHGGLRWRGEWGRTWRVKRDDEGRWTERREERKAGNEGEAGWRR